ncbi:MAG: DUF3488 and DUF4129 domain-containing transglutaminase family protein [Pseudanabaenaceae cyanobacterium]
MATVPVVARSEWQTEESIPLRVLVQLVVFAGIASVDIVAGTAYSVWAIPLSTIGAGWGWYARRKRNIPVKFCMAVGMIAALVVFLNDLVAQQEETRLLLARLLVQLQVLHSFDLPRRKDLGYSVVIGFILLSVAATVSQTMIFAVCLMVFLLLAVPFLILDHRSRLGVLTPKFAPKQLGISPLPLLGLLTLVVVLGLMIFALLPRFSGFQLRNFPLSLNISVQRDIPRGSIITRARGETNGDGNLITADGEGDRGTGGSGGRSNDPEAQQRQERQVLPPLFSTEIDATRSPPGDEDVEPQLVMRVRSQAELFWRVMAYDEFTGKGWRISRNQPEQIRTVKRPSWSYEFNLFGQLPYLAVPTNPDNLREVIQSYTITIDRFPNIVPAASIPYRLFFPSEEIDIDWEGNIRSPGSIPKDLTYTVISGVPRRNPALLRRVRYRYTRDLVRYYLQVPKTPSLRTELGAAVQKLLGNQQFDNPYDFIVALTQAVQANYQLQNLTVPAGEDMVSAFLQAGGGTPIHFVSALVLLLRSQGVPARYVVGFNSGKFNPFTGLYEVYNTDAQSLAEVFFPGFGWLTFDPVPGHPIFPPSVEEDRTFAVWQAFWQWLMGLFPPAVGEFLSNLGGGMVSFIGAIINALLAGGWAGVIAGIAIVFGLLLAGWAVWQVLVYLRELFYFQGLHPVDRAYGQMLKYLSEKGLAKSPHQTPQEYCASIADQLDTQQRAVVQQITQIYQDWRYGERAGSAGLLPKLLRELMRPTSKDRVH